MMELVWTIGSVASCITAGLAIADIAIVLATHGRKGYMLVKTGKR